MNCPECDSQVRSGKCERCGWKEGREISTAPKCFVCKFGQPERQYGGKCSNCGRCHGKSERGRCTFRAEQWDAGRAGYCGWHARVHDDDLLNTFEEFEQWCGRLVKARICDRWTHYTPVMLWDGMGGARGKERVHWCGGSDCPNAPKDVDDPGSPLLPGAVTTPPPRAGAPPEETRDAAWRQKVLEQAEQMRRPA